VKGQTTILYVVWVIVLLFVFVPLLPIMNVAISEGTRYMDPLVKALAYISPFLLLVAIVLIPQGMNKVWNWATERGGRGRGF